jgi:hypothetical protein
VFGVCSSGSCSTSTGPCGGLGQTACGSFYACWAPYVAQSAASSCVPCGGLGEPCCSPPYACGPGFACNSSSGHRCEHCGGPGELCCLGNLCATGSCDSSLRCP